MNEEMRKLIWRLWWLLDVVVEQTGDTIFIDDDSLHEVFANLIGEVDPGLGAQLMENLEEPNSTRPADLWPPENVEPFCAEE